MLCKIDYDGKVNANANSRYWSISDRYSAGNLAEANVSSL